MSQRPASRFGPTAAHGLAVLAVLAVLSGCAGAPAPSSGDAGADAARADAAAPADSAADTDASSVDASPAERPAWLPPLAPACDAWQYDADSPSTFDSAAELATALQQVRCRFAVRCQSSAEQIYCDPLAALPGVLVAPVDVQLAARCLRAWDDSTCEDDAARLEACAGLTWSTAPKGAPCTESQECTSRCLNPTLAHCAGRCAEFPRIDPNRCAGGCPAGERCELYGCTPIVAIGDACDAYRACPDEGLCASGVCVPLPTEGQRCIVLAGLGLRLTFCAPGLGCSGSELCRPITTATRGMPCDDVARCEPGTYCGHGTCLGTAGEGGPCANVFGNTVPPCLPGLYCDARDNTCHRLGGAGAPCSDPRGCEAGLGCWADDPVWGRGGAHCGRLAGPGCACGPALFCPPEFECNAGVCVRSGAFQQACSGEYDCGSRGECVDGRCVRRFVGDACSTLDFCREGICEGPAGRARCAPLLTAGERCDRRRGACASPLVCEWESSGAMRCALPPDRRTCRFE